MKDTLKTVLWFGCSAAWVWFAVTIIAAYKQGVDKTEKSAPPAKFFCPFFCFFLKFAIDSCRYIKYKEEVDMTFFCLLIGACLIGLLGAEVLS